MPAKLVVLGIDAASPDLLRLWAAEGKLPAIRNLIDHGISGSVRGVKGFFIGSTWPSFYTGINPARHGFHRIVQLRSGTYDYFRPLDSPDGVGGTPFWRLASNAGRRVAVLDVPLSRLDPALNGLQMVEWGSHDAVFGFRATPPDVASDVMSRVGAYPLPGSCDGTGRTAADFEQFVTALELAVKKKTDLTLEYLGREQWDLFVQVFTETHCAGHQCWHIHDPKHPAYDPQLRETIGDPLERVYRAIDRAVAAIVEQVGDARVLLVSAHGMSHYRGARFLLPEILVRLGVTARPPVASSETRGVEARLRDAARVAWRMLPNAARESIRPLRARFTTRLPGDDRMPRLRVDVNRSRCFPVANGSPVGAIRLNLVGREPNGVLQSGPGADAFCEELMGDLRAIIDARTGRPLVADVYRTDTLYAGARQDALPDLLVEWNGDLPTGTLAHAAGRGATIRATSAKVGTVEGSNSYVRTGDHIPAGMFVFTGPGVAASERKEPVSVMDFHPTICRLLGLPDPSVDGVAIREFA